MMFPMGHKHSKNKERGGVQTGEVQEAVATVTSARSKYKPRRAELGRGCEPGSSQLGPRFARREAGFESWLTPTKESLTARRRLGSEPRSPWPVSSLRRLYPRKPVPELWREPAAGGTGWCRRANRGKTGTPERKWGGNKWRKGGNRGCKEGDNEG